LASVALTSYSQYTIRARVTELVIAASAFKITISEKWQTDFTLASAGVGLTVTTVGRLAGGGGDQRRNYHDCRHQHIGRYCCSNCPDAGANRGTSILDLQHRGGIRYVGLCAD
jgi:hypothetical protein